MRVFLSFLFCLAMAPAASFAGLPAAAPAKPVVVEKVALLGKLDETLQKQSMKMLVTKTVKQALLEQERTAQGKAWISKGRLRLELEGAEKSLLVMNKKSLWAVTFPDADFKDAPVSVITGSMESRKGRSQSALGVLAHGGFLKVFTPTGSKSDAMTVTFELLPKSDQSDFTRAEVKVSGDGSTLLELKYWDGVQNETRFAFSDIKVEKSMDEKLFSYSPPKGANIERFQ